VLVLQLVPGKACSASLFLKALLSEKSPRHEYKVIEYLKWKTCYENHCENEPGRGLLRSDLVHLYNENKKINIPGDGSFISADFLVQRKWFEKI